jgi:hypothetical protein
VGAVRTVRRLSRDAHFDLYHDAGEVMSDVIRAPAGMYVYPAGTSQDSAYAICSDYTSAASSDGAYEASAGLETGDAFCFRTTQGKLAWATVEAVQPNSYVAVLQVRIWDEPNGSLGSRFTRAKESPGLDERQQLLSPAAGVISRWPRRRP